MRLELTTAALRSLQATHAAVDDSASIQPARSLFISWGKTVQTSGATSDMLFCARADILKAHPFAFWLAFLPACALAVKDRLQGKVRRTHREFLAAQEAARLTIKVMNGDDR